MSFYKGKSGSTYLTGQVITKQKNSVIFRATCCERQANVVIKFIVLPSSTPKPRELLVLEKIQEFDSPLLVKLLDVIECTVNGCAVIGLVFPAYDMNMLEFMLAFKHNARTNHICYLLRQIARAIQLLHENGIVHLDIKLENIMVNNLDQIVIIDFGFADFVAPNTPFNRFCGSYAYVSPEQLLQKPYDPFKSDVWSYGVLAYAMLVNSLPFDTDIEDEKSINALFLSILNKKVHYPTYLSQVSRDLLEHIIDRNVETRFSIIDVLSHSWFKNEANYVPGQASNTPIFGGRLYRGSTSLNVQSVKVAV